MTERPAPSDPPRRIVCLTEEPTLILQPGPACLTDGVDALARILDSLM